jgi:hypothetical protein
VHEQFGDADSIREQRRTETWLKQNGACLAPHRHPMGQPSGSFPKAGSRRFKAF